MGSIDNSVDLDEATKRTGFYFFGKIPVCGNIRSFCAFGKVNTTPYDDRVGDKNVSGSLTFFIVRNLNNNRNRQFRVIENFTLTQSDNTSKVICHDVDIKVRTSDFIVAYIPSFCIEKNDEIFCPLQVGFDGDVTQYYQASDTIFSATKILTEKRFRNMVLNQQRVNTGIQLNVNVTIIESTAAQLGNVTADILQFTSAETWAGLYILGIVPDGCEYQSICTFGRVNTESYNMSSASDKNVRGRMTVFIVRSRDFTVRRSLTLTQDNSSATEVCIRSSTSVTVGGSDLIVVAIPSFCTEMKSTILCPLQVNFEGNGHNTTYYNAPAAVLDEYYESDNDTVITDLFQSSEQRTMMNTFLNVRVLTEGTYNILCMHE